MVRRTLSTSWPRSAGCRPVATGSQEVGCEETICMKAHSSAGESIHGIDLGGRRGIGAGVGTGRSDVFPLASPPGGLRKRERLPGRQRAVVAAPPGEN